MTPSLMHGFCHLSTPGYEVLEIRRSASLVGGCRAPRCEIRVRSSRLSASSVSSQGASSDGVRGYELREFVATSSKTRDVVYEVRVGDKEGEEPTRSDMVLTRLRFTRVIIT